MSRTHSRKTTDVQAEAPAAGPPEVAEVAAPAAAEAPRLSVGWKLALVAWLLCFVGLGAYELVGLFWKLLFS